MANKEEIRELAEKYKSLYEDVKGKSELDGYYSERIHGLYKKLEKLAEGVENAEKE